MVWAKGFDGKKECCCSQHFLPGCVDHGKLPNHSGKWNVAQQLFWDVDVVNSTCREVQTRLTNGHSTWPQTRGKFLWQTRSHFKGLNVGARGKFWIRMQLSISASSSKGLKLDFWMLKGGADREPSWKTCFWWLFCHLDTVHRFTFVLSSECFGSFHRFKSGSSSYLYLWGLHTNLGVWWVCVRSWADASTNHHQSQRTSTTPQHG